MKRNYIILPITILVAVNLILFFVFGLHHIFWPVPEYFSGLAYAPFGIEDNPLEQRFPSLEQVEKDLELLHGYTDSIRLYSSVGVSREIPQLANNYNLSITAGAWLDMDAKTNDQELSALVELSQKNENIKKVVVGNEVLLRGDMEVEELLASLCRIRSEVEQPISTAETWNVWLEYPELTEKVDFLMVHILPYWEGLPVRNAVDYFFMRLEELQDRYPDKQIIIGEVGWPSDGAAFNGAKPGAGAQRYFLTNFITRAEAINLQYYIMEAIDQPWKVDLEGEVGAHWGIFDAHRQWKLGSDSILLYLPVAFWAWFIASLLGLGIGGAFLGIRPEIKLVGLCFSLLILQMSIHALAAAAGELPLWPATRLVIYGPLLLGLALVLCLAIYGTWEMAELLWRTNWIKSGLIAPTSENQPLPFVSIHVPICNEPTAEVLESLSALAKLDYPAYEVLVISNNTEDEKIWRPLQDWCRKQGKQFRFFHIGKIAGYKAGALNYALAKTDPAASIIGVIDSDYSVRHNWLKRTIPYFNQNKVAIVQAPQDHRNEKSLFKQMCNWEYRGFFYLGMVHRNERNAIITHGTMVLFRRSALEEAGVWAEWCICEDTEMGLRLLERGYEAVYVPKIMGQGVLPTNFAAYKAQRTRWAYGAVRIIYSHASALFLGRTKLTPMQRLHFLAGWLPWFGDAMHLLFTFAMTGWSLGMLLRPENFPAPATVLLLPVLLVNGFLLIRTWVLYSARVPCGFTDRLAAANAGLALVPTIGASVLHGLVSSNRPFLRTRKDHSETSVYKALHPVVMELFLFLLLLILLITMLAVSPHKGTGFRLWCLLLALHLIPYLSAVVMSLISASSRKA